MDFKDNLSLAEFRALEQNVLKEFSIETLTSALVQSFKKLHQEQLEIFEDRLFDVETKRRQELQESLNSHLGQQLKEVIETALEDAHARIWLLIAPLIKQSEEDIKRLEAAITQTEVLCQTVQEKYKFRWNIPFLPFLATATLSGTFTALILFGWLAKQFILQ